MIGTNFMLAGYLASLVLILGTGFCSAEDTPRLVLKGHSKPVVDVQFAADGNTVASMSADGETILWDLSAGSGRRFPSLTRSLDAGSFLQFTRESPELLLAGSGGQGLLIDPTKGETIAEYGDRQQLNSGPIVYLGGRRALVANSLVQEIGKAGNLFEVPNMTSEVVEAVSPDGNMWVTNRRFLSAGSGSNRLELIDLSTGKSNGELPKYAYISAVSWVDNQHLLVLHAPGILTLWETAPKVRLVAQQKIDGTSLTASFTGKVAAVTVDKSKAEIFDITNDSIRLRRTVTAQSPIQLSADGGRLLSAGTAYQSYIVTDTSSGSVLLVNKQLEDDLFAEMTSDGQDVVVGHPDGTITFQPVGQPVETQLTLVADLPLKMPPNPKTHPKFLVPFVFTSGEIVFSPKGDACVTHTPGSVNKSMTIAELKPGASHLPVWNDYHGTPTQAKLQSWALTPESVLFVDYQPSGTPSETFFLSATVDFGSGRLVFNTAQGARPLAILGFGINPDQKSIVALVSEYNRKHAGSSSIIQSTDCVVLEYPSGKLVKTLAKDVDGSPSHVRIAFSSSGQRVAILVKQKIRVWNIQSGEELILGEELNYGQFWLIDDGRTLVVPKSGTMRGIDLETNEDAFVWSPEDNDAGEPTAIEFSHDGKYALCGSSIGEVTLRDSHTGAVLLRHAAFDGAIGAVGISQDSTQIAAANAARTLRVWKLGTITKPATMSTTSIEVDSGK